MSFNQRNQLLAKAPTILGSASAIAKVCEGVLRRELLDLNADELADILLAELDSARDAIESMPFIKMRSK